MDKDIYYYQYFTGKETIKLMPEASGRYAVMYGNENLGSYHSAKAAADDVSGGHTFAPSDGTDLADLGIPGDLHEWDKKLFGSFGKLRKA